MFAPTGVLFYLAGLFVIIEVCVRLKLIKLIGDGLYAAIKSAPPAQQNITAVSLLVSICNFRA